ncbi:MAG TPA: hypothetical protein VI113_03035 [Alphaproteobacteria bacterium]
MRHFSLLRSSKITCALAAAFWAALALTMPVTASLHAADAFVAGTEDIPLMPGLAPVDDAGVVFDTPQGRIVEAYAKGDTTRKAVLEFYAQTLPQLGWSAAGTRAYRREGEVLRLELYQEKGRLTVRFYLSPS